MHILKRDPSRVGGTQQCKHKLCKDASYCGNHVIHSPGQSILPTVMHACAQEMSEFQVKAEAELRGTEAELEAAKQRFAELARYVNGAANAAVADSQALFAVLAAIVADLDAVHAENLAAAEKVRLLLS